MKVRAHRWATDTVHEDKILLTSVENVMYFAAKATAAACWLSLPSAVTWALNLLSKRALTSPSEAQPMHNK